MPYLYHTRSCETAPIALVSSGIPSLDGVMGENGYPDRSAVLVVGPPGIGKEALSYWFIESGLAQGDFCLYLTRLSVREVIHDIEAFGIDFSKKVPFWMLRPKANRNLT